jgi:hypothetical protein
MRRGYAKIAPGAPHAQHMPSHIFTRVGYWKESIAPTSWRGARREGSKDFHDQLHAMDYLVYAYLQLGQDKKAKAVIDEMTTVAGFTETFRPDRMRWRHRRRAMRSNAATGRRRRASGPAEPAAPCQAITHFARALGAARSGNPEAAKADIAKLGELRDKLRDAKDAYWSEQVDIQGRSRPPGCSMPKASTTRRSRR